MCMEFAQCWQNSEALFTVFYKHVSMCFPLKHMSCIKVKALPAVYLEDPSCMKYGNTEKTYD